MSAPNPCAQAQAHREAILYPSLFGPRHRGLTPIPAGMFTEVFGVKSFDPRWTQQCGVCEFLPTGKRASHLYVTSGLSNAWDGQPDPQGRSGLGGEFVLETSERAPWAATRLLYLMAYQFLAANGLYPGGRVLQDFVQVPLNTPVGTQPSALNTLLLAPPAGFLRRYTGQTGWFDFYQVVGISAAEAAAGERHGGPALLQLLRQEGAFPVTFEDRKSLA